MKSDAAALMLESLLFSYQAGFLTSLVAVLIIIIVLHWYYYLVNFSNW